MPYPHGSTPDPQQKLREIQSILILIHIITNTILFSSYSPYYSPIDSLRVSMRLLQTFTT